MPTNRRDEMPIDFLRRLVRALGYEKESINTDLPSTEAVIEYFKLWDVYDTEFLAGISECIAEGADPAPYNDFVRKYNLSWRIIEDADPIAGFAAEITDVEDADGQEA